MTNLIRVCIVEDEASTAEAHALYLNRLGGFEVVFTAHLGSAALHWLSHNRHGVDLVLLDMNLPDMSGTEVARQLRIASLRVDIIAVTAVRDLDTVRASLDFGAVQYLIKPFSFVAFAEKLRHYQLFRQQLCGASGGDYVAESSQPPAPTHIEQRNVDAALAALRSPGGASLPKGLSSDTLDTVVEFLRQHRAAISAGELTEALGISRITARRYLEYLSSSRQVEREPRYGSPGRPELEYRWRGAEGDHSEHTLTP